MPGSNDDIPRERTGPIRRLSSEAEPHDWHDRLVEHFGANGAGGDWARMKHTVERHDVEIGQLKELKWKLMGVITAGGLIAGLLGWLIPQLLGRH